ncbi:MAG: post-transcriptional regulator [Ignavibacteriales bacterium]
MDLEFNSIEELYERLKPALITKCSEMKRDGYKYIKEEDIWNYLKEVKWKKAVDLGLHEMVRDVLNTENARIDNYLKEKLNLGNRKLYFED